MNLLLHNLVFDRLYKPKAFLSVCPNSGGTTTYSNFTTANNLPIRAIASCPSHRHLSHALYPSSYIFPSQEGRTYVNLGGGKKEIVLSNPSLHPRISCKPRQTRHDQAIITNTDKKSSSIQYKEQHTSNIYRICLRSHFISPFYPRKRPRGQWSLHVSSPAPFTT